jgi:hypothetical protein
MKPCSICKQPKTYHTWYRVNIPGGHKFEMDNLIYLERKAAAKELVDKHHKLNFCQICKQNRKSPFGICQECSEKYIKGVINDTLV